MLDGKQFRSVSCSTSGVKREGEEKLADPSVRLI